MTLEDMNSATGSAGIGGWPLALEYAGWRGGAWTGSCPCQPLSSAGKRKGDADERHLWPAFQLLIAECRPVCVFGEQVSSKLGREWFAAVQTDLESVGYACGAADISAAGVGAPHIRQRLYWVATDGLANAERNGAGRTEEQSGAGNSRLLGVEKDGCTNQLGADGPLDRHEWCIADGCEEPDECDGTNCILGLGNANVARPQGRGGGLEQESSERAIESGGAADGLADAATPRFTREWDGGTQLQVSQSGQFTGQSNADWRDVEWLSCADGKARPTKPGIHPLASRLPGRVGQLRAYGNAIVPQVAATFVRSFMEIAC